MSQSDWYHDRAAECDRKAVASRNPLTRSRHIKDRDSWQAIADSVDAEEKAVHKQKEKQWGLRISGPRSGKCPPRRGPFLPSNITSPQARAEPANERCLTGLRAAAKSVLFFTDKILAIDAIAAAVGCCRWR